MYMYHSRKSYGQDAQDESHVSFFSCTRDGKISSSLNDDECLQVIIKALRLIEAAAFLPRLVVN